MASSQWVISNLEFSNYFSFYHEVVPEGELLSGYRAKELFLLSNLLPKTLSQVWKLADIDEDGQLNAAEFAVAIHLIQHKLNGISVPTSLPEELRDVALKVTHPEDYIIRAKTNQVLKCQSAFLSFCENISGTGYLTAEAARYLLTNSHLSKGQLFHIWKLSDADKDGRLSFEEFVVAMHLIFIAKLDQPLPVYINHSSLFPEEFQSICLKVAIRVNEKPPIKQQASSPPPLIPAFVIPVDNSSVHYSFKSIPSEKFKNGMFDSCAGDPFLSIESNEAHIHDSQEDLSNSSQTHSSRLSNSESAEISKLPLSHHSSVKSLVEERDEPTLQQAQSIDVESPGRNTPTEAKQDSSDEENMDEKTKAELEQISQASQKFLAETGGPLPKKEDTYKDPYAHAPEMKVASQKGLSSVIDDISDKENISEAKTDDKQNGSDSTVDFLAQLDDLEAEIMNVLDDTNSFDPMKAIAPPVESKPAVLPVSKPPKPPVSYDETDFNKKTKTLPSMRSGSSSKDPSPVPSRGERKGSARSSSDSSEPSPSPRRFTVASSSPARKKLHNVNRNSAILDDLDDLFASEMATIDNMIESQHSKEKEAEERERRESEELKKIEKKAMETPELPRLTVSSVEELKKRREVESAQKLSQWEQELKQIEIEARENYEEQIKRERLLDEQSINELEKEWEEMLEQESKNFKESWAIRDQREKEEEQKREEMRKKVSEKKEVTIEEWIQMMEENKVKQMTPEEKAKYDERKRVWIEHRRQKEEKHRQEMEEKLTKSRERMAAEYVRVRNIEEEVKQTRLEWKEKDEEQLKKEAEERKFRSEQSKQRREEEKLKEIEENKSKARSALAARWEQQVKGRNTKDYKNTVLTGSPIKDTTSSSKEADRLARRVGKID